MCHDEVTVFMRCRVSLSGRAIQHDEIAPGSGQKEPSRAADRRVGLKLVMGPERDDTDRFPPRNLRGYDRLHDRPKVFETADQTASRVFTRSCVQFEIGRRHFKPGALFGIRRTVGRLCRGTPGRAGQTSNSSKCGALFLEHTSHRNLSPHPRRFPLVRRRSHAQNS